MPYILMQSTSVDVVSVKPAAAAEPEGHALYVAGSVTARVSDVDGAADAGELVRAGTPAVITAIAAKTPIRRFRLERILPP
jgi:hypothetical protein